MELLIKNAVILFMSTKNGTYRHLLFECIQEEATTEMLYMRSYLILPSKLQSKCCIYQSVKSYQILYIILSYYCKMPDACIPSDGSISCNISITASGIFNLLEQCCSRSSEWHRRVQIPVCMGPLELPRESSAVVNTQQPAQWSVQITRLT